MMISNNVNQVSLTPEQFTGLVEATKEMTRALAREIRTMREKFPDLDDETLIQSLVFSETTDFSEFAAKVGLEHAYTTLWMRVVTAAFVLLEEQ